MSAVKFNQNIPPLLIPSSNNNYSNEEELSSLVKSIKTLISSKINQKVSKSIDTKRQLLKKVKSIAGSNNKDEYDNMSPSSHINKSQFNQLLINHGITNISASQLDALFNDYVNAKNENLDFDNFYKNLNDNSNDNNSNWHLFSEEKHLYHPTTGEELVSLPSPPPIANNASGRKIKLRILQGSTPVAKEEKVNGVLPSLMDIKLIEYVQEKTLTYFSNQQRLLRFIESHGIEVINTVNIKIIWNELNLQFTNQQNDILNKYIFGFNNDSISNKNFIISMIPSDYGGDYFAAQPSGRQKPTDYSLRKLNAKLKVLEEVNLFTPRISRYIFCN